MIFRRKGHLSSRLKHQLVLQERAVTADNIGGHSRVWVDVATLWAEITPISGRETFAYSQQTNRQRFRITLRYRNDITPHMRLHDIAGDRMFDIRSIINQREQGEEIEILADVAFPTA